MSNSTTTVYSKGKIQVHFFNVGSFQHIMNCHCKTIGCEKEKTYLLKKVNFYRFKYYMENVKQVPNFNTWHQMASIVDTQTALTDFINYSEGRTAYYVAPDSFTLALDGLISKADAITNNMRSIIATM